MESGLFYFLVLAIACAPFLVLNWRITNAKRKHEKAKTELNRWLAEHPNASRSWPLARDLLREHLCAWREYVRICPVMDDGGILERHLNAFLNEESDRPLPYPMA